MMSNASSRNAWPGWLVAVILSIALVMSVVPIVVRAQTYASSITQYGITWTFDRSYPVGQFVTGDWWVVGPVTITSINPPSVTLGGRTIHGSMLNPIPDDSRQGFDSAMNDTTYRDSLNVGNNMPLYIGSPSSLVSSISHLTAGRSPQLTDAAVLTVLDEVPPDGSFRPPYLGTDKTIIAGVDDLNYNVLETLDVVAYTPDIDVVAAKLKRPWVEVVTGSASRYAHPSNNQPVYGRDMARTLSDALLLLQLDYSDSKKEDMLVRVVQYGIDVYGGVEAGGEWTNDGPHNAGRKMPLILAGLVLGDSSILHYADADKHFIFQEDQQTWDIDSSDIGRPLYGGDGVLRVEYESVDVGKPEWGTKHSTEPELDGRNWNVPYREETGSALIGHALTAYIMGADELWNWRQFFNYLDRFWGTENLQRSSANDTIDRFPAEMWGEYRADYNQANIPVGTTLNTCVSFEYTGWGECIEKYNVQVRTITGRYPDRCVGGSPELSRDCPKEELPACNDDIDNDRDGYIDYPSDPGCSDREDSSESNSAPNALLPTTRVIVSPGPAYVYQSPNGTRLGIQVTGARGSIMAGPLYAGGKWWYQVNFDLRPDGWVETTMLDALTSSIPTTNDTVVESVRDAGGDEDVLEITPNNQAETEIDLSNPDLNEPGSVKVITNEEVVREQLLAQIRDLIALIASLQAQVDARRNR